MTKARRYVPTACAVVCAVALVVFFHVFYRAHLCHREQFSLFLWAPGPLAAYWTSPAPLARLVGDMLTQFLGLPFVGALIMSAVLTLLGVLVYRLFARWIGLWALVPAALAVLFETGRQSGLTYPLSSTLQWVGIVATLLTAHRVSRPAGVGRAALGVVVLAAGIGLFGWGDWEKRAVNRPDMNVERMLAVDNDWYHGRLRQLERRLDRHASHPDRFDAYYRNLLLASQYHLGDNLMQHYQPFQLGLFLPVESTASYPIIYFSGELWFQVGDMTNAEHSALLGMLFSPNSVGCRPLMRLAEISLIRGDEAAAMKYLRLLDKTLLYHRWARMHMPQNRPKEVRRWVELKRTLLCTTDTVRVPMDIGVALHHLVEDNPDNVFAREYLYAFDLLGKDLDAFMDDYVRFQPDGMPPQRTWAEAMLLWMTAHGGDERTHGDARRERMGRDIPPEVVDAFVSFTEQFRGLGSGPLTADSQMRQLQQKFGKTYWFFYHFAEMR